MRFLCSDNTFEHTHMCKCSDTFHKYQIINEFKRWICKSWSTLSPVNFKTLSGCLLTFIYFSCFWNIIRLSFVLNDEVIFLIVVNVLFWADSDLRWWIFLENILFLNYIIAIFSDMKKNIRLNYFNFYRRNKWTITAFLVSVSVEIFECIVLNKGIDLDELREFSKLLLKNFVKYIYFEWKLIIYSKRFNRLFRDTEFHFKWFSIISIWFYTSRAVATIHAYISDVNGYHKPQHSRTFAHEHKTMRIDFIINY